MADDCIFIQEDIRWMCKTHGVTCVVSDVTHYHPQGRMDRRIEVVCPVGVLDE